MKNPLKGFCFRWEAIPISMVLAWFGAFGGGLAHCNHIKKNLEPNAIYCGFKNNHYLITGGNIILPRITNKDMDNNGKYESILIYKDKGIKMYQEITKDKHGNLEFSDTKPY